MPRTGILRLLALGAATLAANTALEAPPRAIVQKLNVSINQALRTADMKAE